MIYMSAAGSMLCQIVTSLLLLPVWVARPLLSFLLDLLPPLDRLNKLLPAATPLEEQELQWPLHGQTFTFSAKSSDVFLFFFLELNLDLKSIQSIIYNHLPMTKTHNSFP